MQIKHIKQKLRVLLKKSEHLTRTDVVYVAKGGSWLMLGKGVATILGFFLTVGFANLLTP